MAHIEPGQALARLERALRQIMEYCYSQTRGPNWLTQVAREGKPEKWAGVAEVESKKRGKRGVAFNAHGGLKYAELYELREILKANWEPVSRALGDQAEALALVKRFDDLRNTVAHSRELVPFEEDLLAGIAGDIENRVTIYMSSQDPSGDTYPRITGVMDSYGHEPDAAMLGVGTCCFVQTGMTLRPGDVVTFSCHGRDPQGRELEWSLQKMVGGSAWYEPFFAAHAVGSDVSLTWTVGPESVRLEGSLGVAMRALGTEYHAGGWVDHEVIFKYRIDPPSED